MTYDVSTDTIHTADHLNPDDWAELKLVFKKN